MSDPNLNLAEVIEETSYQMRAVATHLKADTSSVDELRECRKLITALAEAIGLYADKMPNDRDGGRHALRRRPPST